MGLSIMINSDILIMIYLISYYRILETFNMRFSFGVLKPSSTSDWHFKEAVDHNYDWNVTTELMLIEYLAYWNTEPIVRVGAVSIHHKPKHCKQHQLSLFQLRSTSTVFEVCGCIFHNKETSINDVIHLGRRGRICQKVMLSHKPI